MQTETTTVTYNKESLVITIPTKSAEALHSQIIAGLITSLKNGITSPGNMQDKDSLITLAELLSHLMPTEFELARGKTAA